MARLISAKGVTAGGTIGSPMEGMKWVVKWALVVLHTGTTTGNRFASMFLYPANNSNNAGVQIAYTGLTSSTSATIAGIGSVINQTGGNVANLTQYYQYPEIFAIDVIQLNVELQSGDTVDYYILVQEEAS
jgi:hypothetical protein